MSPRNSTANSAFINHLGLTRGSFNGDGDLLVTVMSWEHKDFEECPLIELEEVVDEYVETLSNFQKQRMQIEFFVDVIDEWFRINDVIAFIKPVQSGYPRG